MPERWIEQADKSPKGTYSKRMSILHEREPTEDISKFMGEIG
jgi:hypothetical protein